MKWQRFSHIHYRLLEILRLISEKDYDGYNNDDNAFDYDNNNGKVNSIIDESISEYLLPYSDSTYISYSDLNGFSKEEVSLARNEIYARRGRKFKKATIKKYFESKSWYYPTYNPDDFPESVFNKYEKENIKTIVQYEKDHGWR